MHHLSSIYTNLRLELDAASVGQLVRAFHRNRIAIFYSYSWLGLKLVKIYEMYTRETPSTFPI
jgi:hypothetical protein